MKNSKQLGLCRKQSAESLFLANYTVKALITKYIVCKTMICNTFCYWAKNSFLYVTNWTSSWKIIVKNMTLGQRKTWSVKAVFCHNSANILLSSSALASALSWPDVSSAKLLHLTSLTSVVLLFVWHCFPTWSK